jgi:hypothetical protein
LIAALTITTALLGSAGPSSAAAKHTAILYGDSLAWETTINVRGCHAKKACHTKTISQFMAAYPDWRLIVRAIPGRAPCDFLPNRPVTQPALPNLAKDLAKYRPNVVMLETEGNSQTNCMIDPNTGTDYVPGSDGYYNQYRTDLDTFFGLVTRSGAKLVVVPPIVTSNPPAASVSSLDQLAATETAKFPHAATTTAPSLAVTNNGTFTFTLPCLATETAANGCGSNHLIAVREPLRVHFCPAGIVAELADNGCPVYSSGAFRFGRSLASQIIWGNNL